MPPAAQQAFLFALAPSAGSHNGNPALSAVHPNPLLLLSPMMPAVPTSPPPVGVTPVKIAADASATSIPKIRTRTLLYYCLITAPWMRKLRKLMQEECLFHHLFMTV